MPRRKKEGTKRFILGLLGRGRRRIEEGEGGRQRKCRYGDGFREKKQHRPTPGGGGSGEKTTSGK